MTPNTTSHELTNEENTIKVTLSDCDEGKWGTYNPNDPNDTPLLRLDVTHKDTTTGMWEPAHNASYCTGVTTNTDPLIITQLLALALNEIDGWLNNDGTGITFICEALSHMTPNWVTQPTP